MEGKHTYCLSNKFSHNTHKVVAFTVHGPEEKKKYIERITNSDRKIIHVNNLFTYGLFIL